MANFNKLRPWQGWIITLGCVLLLLLSGLGRLAQAQSTLTVATEPAFPPFEFQAADGQLQGFDIDLMRAIGEAADLQVQFQSLPFDGIVPALQSGTVDAAISAMTITAERLQAIGFSRPYFKAGLAIAIRSNQTGITTLESLENRAIAVQIGTTGAEVARTISGARIRTFDSAPLALQELLNGNVDAVINDAPVTLYAIQSNNLQGLRVASELLTEEFYGIATPRNSPYLNRINQGLNTLLENGTYAQIYRRWFNAPPPELPEAIAIEQTAELGQNALPSSLRVIAIALPTLLQGTLITLQLAALAVLLGLVAGSLIGIARLSPITPLRWITRAYVDFFRGTPLLVQIFMVYFGLPALLQNFGFTFTLNRFAAAILALSLNSAAYLAEIVRAGIQSIETGQTEAAQSLGLGSVQTMRYVILPQAFRRMLPALGNEFITLLKDTSLVAVIGFEELFRRGQLIVAANYRPFELYAIVALIYLTLTVLASRGFSYLEQRMNPLKRSPIP